MLYIVYLPVNLKIIICYSGNTDAYKMGLGKSGTAHFLINLYYHEVFEIILKNVYHIYK